MNKLKTKYTIARVVRKKQRCQNQSFDETQIERVETMKCLGTIIDDKF